MANAKLRGAENLCKLLSTYCILAWRIFCELPGFLILRTFFMRLPWLDIASLDKFLIQKTVDSYSCETNVTPEQKEFGILAYWWEVSRTCKTAQVNSKPIKREERFALFPGLDRECKEIALSINQE